MTTKLSRAIAALACSFVSAQSMALNVVLTNDDGWDAAGIQAMKQALLDAGHTVILSGSLTEQSGSSGAVNLSDLQVVKQRSTAGALEYSVAQDDGVSGAEPATAAVVGLSIAEQAFGGPPDLVVSGINAGQNLGIAALISGTVGAANAAMSSALGKYQVPAVAISTDELCDDETPECEATNAQHYQRVAQWTARFVGELEAATRNDPLMPAGYGVNINYPGVEHIAGTTLNRQGRTISSNGAPISIGIGCHADCVNVADGTAVAAGLTGFFPLDLKEVRNADTTDNAKGNVTVVPIFGDYYAGGPDNPSEAARFNIKLKKVIRALNK